MFTNSIVKNDETKASIERTRTELAKLAKGPGPFLFKDESYVMLESTFDLIKQSKVCSVGSGLREIIFLDMHSEKLREYLDRFLKKYVHRLDVSEAIEDVSDDEALTPRYDTTEDGMVIRTFSQPKIEMKSTPVLKIELTKKPQTYLKNIIEFVRQNLGSYEISEDEIQRIIAAYQKNAESEEDKTKVPLECFLEFNRGFCRHHSLLTAYLLVQLSLLAKQSISDFDITTTHVYHFRGKLSRFHSVIVYETEGRLYLVDPSFNFTADVTTMDLKLKVQLEAAYKNQNIVSFVNNIISKYSRQAEVKLEEKPASLSPKGVV